jgi:hypothetical protein
MVETKINVGIFLQLVENKDYLYKRIGTDIKILFVNINGTLLKKVEKK